MAKKTMVQDAAGELLSEMIKDFSVKRAIAWLERKFPSFDTSRAQSLSVGENKNDKRFFLSARVLGFITELSESKNGNSNRPVLVAAVEMKNDLTERTSRQSQFDFARRTLQEAVKSGSTGLNGFPSQGIFFFYDKDQFFRISLVSGNVEGRRFKFNEAKRQSFYINPDRPNNVAKSRLQEPIRTFYDLKEAFSVETLTKEFYSRLFEWYEWAMKSRTGVTFPNDLDDDKDDKKFNNESVIRLITRLMFTWFIRQRGLVPDEFFKVDGVSSLLKKFDSESMEEDNYYRAILQNLFFATFNCQPERRTFRKSTGNGSCKNDWGIKTLYRYEKEFRNSAEFKKMMKKVPFLNCALFDCLDKQEREQDGGRTLLFDGFSDTRKRQAHVPNGLFFDRERGIVKLFDTYEFTIDENNADDADVALDPELLGKVFENLLGAFNPETSETARKSTGSFYTLREIVDYMVEESLKNHLKTKVPALKDEWIEDLFDKSKAAEKAELPFGDSVAGDVREALYTCRILDPACGSGAFPMGILHCMVRLFARLDPSNTDLNDRLIARYKAETKQAADPLLTEPERTERLEALKVQLTEGQHYPDYARKLYLIENCIYGVDIQPIATQISKLRFFISLLCDQLKSNWNENVENHGLLSLPNLEAKFVCANTLISLPDTEGELGLSVSNISKLRERLQENRHRIFAARTYRQKDRLKAKDMEIRDQIRDAVRSTLAKPDKKLITIQEEIIENLKCDRKRYEDARMVKKSRPVQDSLFGVPPQGELGYEMIDLNKPKRDEIDDQIRYAQRKIDAENAKSKAENVSAIDKLAKMVAGWDPYDQNASSSFFDPKWMFNIENGFDIVIGNPPYGIINKRQNKSVSILVSEDVLKYYKDIAEYAEARGRGFLNIYRLFVQKSLNLLGRDGIFAEIFPLAFACDLSAAKLRQFVFSKYRVLSFDAFPERDNPQKRVFEAAKMSVCILIVQNGLPNGDMRLRINLDRFIDGCGGCFFVSEASLSLLDPEYMRLPIVGEQDYQILIKMRNKARRLVTHTCCKEGELNITFDRVAFTTNSTFPEMLRGAGIGRYEVREGLSQGEHLFIDEQKVMNPERIAPLKSQKRLVMQGITGVNERWRLKATLVQGVYCANSTNYIAGLDNMHFVLGLFNSKLMNFFFGKFSTNSNVNGYEVDELPLILSVSLEKQAPIIALVDRILAAKKEDPNADTSALEAEIDQLVYKLYGLTEEEIAIVEGRGNGEEPGAEAASGKTKTRRAAKPAVASTARDYDDEELE